MDCLRRRECDVRGREWRKKREDSVIVRGREWREKREDSVIVRRREGRKNGVEMTEEKRDQPLYCDWRYFYL